MRYVVHNAIQFRLQGHPLSIKEYGLKYYDDLQQRISREEALDIFQVIKHVCVG